jgi:hypothetical protein
MAGFTGFDWDAGNVEKNWRRHHVSRGECEEVFFSHPLVLVPAVVRTTVEPRYYALGRSVTGRSLFIVFTRRGDRLRVISARDMSRRERRIHAQAQDEP